MIVIGQIDYEKLLSTIPNLILMIFVIYSLSDQFIIKYFKHNRYSMSFFALEYQYLKWYAYIKYAAMFLNEFDCSYLIAFLLIDICEGMATNSSYIFENFIFKESISLDSTIRNLKMYLTLNIVTLIYYSSIWLCNSPSSSLWENECSKIYEAWVYAVMFIFTCSKIQCKFNETSILSKIAEKQKNFLKFCISCSQNLLIKIKNNSVIILIFISKNRIQIHKNEYRKTPCPVPPLNDNNFVKFMRGTGQGVQIYLQFLLKNEWKYLCYDD